MGNVSRPVQDSMIGRVAALFRERGGAAQW